MPTSPLRCGCSGRATRVWKHHEKHHPRSLDRHRERNLSWSRPRKRRYGLSLSSGRDHGRSTASPELMFARHDGPVAGSAFNGSLAFETSRQGTSRVAFTNTRFLITVDKGQGPHTSKEVLDRNTRCNTLSQLHTHGRHTRCSRRGIDTQGPDPPTHQPIGRHALGPHTL